MTNLRRKVRAILASAAMLVAIPCFAGAEAKPGGSSARDGAYRPNILFVLVDDLGFGDLSLTGNAVVSTPNIDALARDGLVMTQFYDAAPICSPSRAALMTGQFPARNRFVTFIDDRKRNRDLGQADWLDPNIPTLASALHAAGYATGHFGKWHLGGGRDVGDAPLPEAYGFDESYTQFEGLGPRVLASDIITPLARKSEVLGRGRIDWLPRWDFTGRYIDKTLDFARRNKAHPWFAQLWLDDVHTPWRPSAEQLAAVKDKGRSEGENRFFAVLVAMDAQIGRLVAGLREADQLDRTLIVFTSDNGPMTGQNNPGSAGPWRGRKASLYEGGIRQPLIIRWPRQVRPHCRDDSSVVSAVDMVPTLARIGGAAIPAGGDGVDVSAAWHGNPIRSRPDIYTHIGRPRSEAALGPLYSIRSGPWKLLMDIDGSGMELYNLTADPGETRNRAGREPAITRELSTKLARWIASLPQPGPAVGR
jgi:arylsulfatase A-like enzyme